LPIKYLSVARKRGAGFAWRLNAAGNYLLRAVDDHGRADSRELRVAVVQ
jgi:membrane carboxypeptidase/penicillin-binding protein PbpC